MSLAGKKYTNALFEVAQEQKCLDEIYAQFKAVYEEICTDKEFAKILDTKILTATEKKKIFDNALKDANPYLLNFFRIQQYS